MTKDADVVSWSAIQTTVQRKIPLKVYNELERMLKVSEIKMSVDKVLALAKTITTIQIKLPLNKEVYTQTMLMARHQKIAKLFDEEFWVTQ